MNNSHQTREELADEILNLKNELSSLKARYEEQSAYQQTIEFNLQERTKELNCLHSLMETMNDRGLTHDEIFERIVQFIPLAWQFPEQTDVCLSIKEKQFKTPQFSSAAPNLSEAIVIDGTQAGTIVVCLTGEPPHRPAHTFLPEETTLLRSIAFYLAAFVEKVEKEQILYKSEQKYRALFDESPDGILIFQGDSFIECNAAVERMLGGSRSMIIGRSPVDISPEFQLNGKTTVEYATQVISETYEKKRNSFEFLHRRFDGSEFLVQVDLSVIVYEGYTSLLVTWRDITRQKEMEEQLRKSEEKYRIIFETVQDVYYEASIDGTILEISPSISILTKGQYSREDLLGKPMASFYEDPEFRNTFLLELSKTGSLSDFELVLRNRDGSIIPASVSSGIIYGENGLPVKITGSLRDITERRKAEQELRKFRTISDIANYGIAMSSLDGIMIYSNRAFAEMHGWEVPEVLGKSLSMFHNKEQMVRVQETIDLLQKDGQFTAEEVWRTRKDGSIFPSLMNAMIIMENNQPVFMSATAIDITELKESEKKIMELNANLEIRIAERTSQLAETNNTLLKEIEERRLIQEALIHKTNELENFFSVALDLLCIADTSGHFIKVNKAWADILGYSVEDLEHRQFLEFVHPDDIQSTLDAMSQLSEQHPILDFINRYRTKDGNYRFIEWHSVPVGNLIYAAARDITERIKTEEELRRARLESEKANLAKSEFLSRMSHELRTPMNSILGFAQLMEMGELSPGQKKGVSHILRSGRHLLELINEVLDISRIEAGRISLSLEPVELSGVIREMIDTVQIQAAGRHIHLEFAQTDASFYSVKVDRQKLKQILLNLLNNAIKYNREGGLIRITAEVMPSQNEGATFIRISLKDTGHGISKEDIPRLFTPFERIGAENTETEGTGLGLAVVKKLVEVMHGNIDVDSVPGEGSTFWFEFMMVENQLESYKNGGNNREFLSKYSGKSGCILYIEDNKPNIELVEDILESTCPGIRLVTTMYGKQAVDLAVEHMPGLILLDLNLPDMHGSNVLKLLLADTKTKDIPVIVISADALQDQVQKLRKAGARDYLTKPLDVKSFLATLDKHFLGS